MINCAYCDAVIATFGRAPEGDRRFCKATPHGIQTLLVLRESEYVIGDHAQELSSERIKVLPDPATYSPGSLLPAPS
jgi:hypothetical protein